MWIRCCILLRNAQASAVSLRGALEFFDTQQLTDIGTIIEVSIAGVKLEAIDHLVLLLLLFVGDVVALAPLSHIHCHGVISVSTLILDS